MTRCLHSVCRHAPPTAEILVVDDGSPDSIISNTAAAFPQVGVVKRTTQGGFCVAAQTGVLAARGAIVELLNDDTEVTPGWADAALEHFCDPEIGAVAPLVLRPAGRSVRIDSAGDRYALTGIARKRGHREAVGPKYLRPCRVFGASGSSAFYRREAVVRVGGFPVHFGAYFEDVDLAFRLQRAGYATQYEPRSRVFHHVGASHGPVSGLLLEQQSRNEERVFWRNIPGRALPRALPLHGIVLAAKAFRHWRAGTLAPFLRGRVQVVREIAALWAHRRALQELGDGADLATWRVETLLL